MALGTCMQCGALTPISPRGAPGDATGHLRIGDDGKLYNMRNSRWAAWYPDAHRGPDGNWCKGAKREIK